jgi:hypothetical protein
MRPFRLLPAFALALSFSLPLAAQDAEAEYRQLLTRFQAQDTTVDVTALRMAYTRTEGYDPYGQDRELVNAMWDHLRAERHAQSAEAAETLLKENWLDIAAHMAAVMSYGALDADSAARLHAFAVASLVGSVGGPDDGRTTDAPMRVISTTEEYAYLNFHGLRRGNQALGSCAGGVRCDILEVEDEKGAKFDLFFDIDIPFGYLSRSMNRGADADAPAARAKGAPKPASRP